MRLSQVTLYTLALLEPPDVRPMEIVVVGEEDRRIWGRAYMNNFPPLADKVVIRVHYGTVKSLISHKLVSLHHTDHRGNHHLRLNARGRAAIKQGSGTGLEFHCPDCFKLILPSFPLHDCPE